jgi:hypothetical protein
MTSQPLAAAKMAAAELKPLIQALCQVARVTFDAWDGGEEAADEQGRTAVEKEHAKAVNDALDVLVALVPESDQPFYDRYAATFAEDQLLHGLGTHAEPARDAGIAAENVTLRAELLEERARNKAARLRLGDLKAVHSQWYDGKLAGGDAAREMESIACSAHMYLAGINGPLLHEARAALAERSDVR